MTTDPAPTTNPTLATPEQLAMERHRRYVLEQLGIAPLVSLHDAPGAAPVRRLHAPAPQNAEMANSQGESAAVTNARSTDRASSPRLKDSSAIAAMRANLSQASGSKAGLPKAPLLAVPSRRPFLRLLLPRLGESTKR